MIRITGQCLLFILVASCGGILMNKFVSDVTDEQLKKFLNSEVYGEVRLRAVSLKTFRRQLAETRSHYDLLRIFYDRKGISDSEIDELLNARIFHRLPGHLHSRELSPSENYPDENYQVYGDFTLQDPVPSTVEDLERAYEHIEEMENSMLADCRYPQPEVTQVRAEGSSKHKLYFPECTVVYRCRNVSGCCHNASTVCGPKSIEVIVKSFFVLEMTGPDSIQPDKVQMVETREFINHTECECQEVKGLPGCNQECPHPFVRMRPGLKCTCDCKDDDFVCLEVKMGLKSLPEDLLECIKHEICMKPECDVEEFDIKSGYCPSALPLFDLEKRHSHRHRVHFRSRSQRHKSHHKRHNQRHDKEKEISIV